MRCLAARRALTLRLLRTSRDVRPKVLLALKLLLFKGADFAIRNYGDCWPLSFQRRVVNLFLSNACRCRLPRLFSGDRLATTLACWFSLQSLPAMERPLGQSVKQFFGSIE